MIEKPNSTSFALATIAILGQPPSMSYTARRLASFPFAFPGAVHAYLDGTMGSMA
ncbi:hypothetical protein [Nitrosomonas sp. ANs5]|uniref:hypothetical protein n=1 Tax=Nitrosomonas sp. ANs5 TaxID=3423941 RepID=UPI003D32A7CF